MITAIVQSRALSGEVGVGGLSKQKKRKGGAHLAAGILELSGNTGKAVIYEVYCTNTAVKLYGTIQGTPYFSKHSNSISTLTVILRSIKYLHCLSKGIHYLLYSL